MLPETRLEVELDYLDILSYLIMGKQLEKEKLDLYISMEFSVEENFIHFLHFF